jgi:hypothetical protein
MGNYSNKVMSKMPHQMKGARFALEINRIFRAKQIKEKYKMGYRSMVAYTIRFTAQSNGVDSPTDEEVNQCKASFYTFLAEAKSKFSGCFTEEFGVKVDEFNFALNFFADHVKWYEDYEDVKAHNALQDLSKSWADENKHIGGIFMRIGEEMDDIVEEAWGEHDWEWLSIRREIVADWMPE